MLTLYICAAACRLVMSWLHVQTESSFSELIQASGHRLYRVVAALSKRRVQTGLFSVVILYKPCDKGWKSIKSCIL